MQTIKNITGFPDRQNNPRVNQQRILPSAVKSRSFGAIIFGSPSSNALGSGVNSGVITISNATNRSVAITASDAFKRTLLVSPDIAIFIGSVTSANQWPNSTYHMGNLPITIFNDWGLTNNVNTVTRVGIYNNTGSSRDVIIVYRARFIRNPVAGETDANV